MSGAWRAIRRGGRPSMGRGGFMAALGLAIALAILGDSRPVSGDSSPPHPVVVSSKNFSESVIVSEILAQLLEAKGVPVERRLQLQGTWVCYNALKAGEIDVYPEYTGTAWIAILKQAPLRDRSRMEPAVKTMLASEGLTWTEALGFENSYTLAMREEEAQRRGLVTISDLARLSPGMVLGVSIEFMERPDGYPGLEAAYGLKFKERRSLDPGLTYEAQRQGTVDVIDAYTTDGRIRSYGLRVLRDDRHFFPPYQAAFLARTEVLAREPRLGEVIGILAGRIDPAEMITLNFQVDREGRRPADVAARFLADEGLIPRPAATRDPGGDSFLDHLREHRAELVQLTAEHLKLTGLAVLAAALVGLPLGVILTRRRRLAPLVLGAIGVLQTIPSIALVGFLIPILGIGMLPAVLALFLYSLLPIVQNTYTGVAAVPPDLLEAGRGMGMTRHQLLWMVELPMALPVLLAGVRTATVICVGTATLASLIGAGGLGEPIFRGINMMSPPIILRGAIPAAMLAILLDLVLAFLQRALVPPPLRR